MKLDRLLKGIPAFRIAAPSDDPRIVPKLERTPVSNPHRLPNPEIASVHCRAQDVTPGGLFVAVAGFRADGHAFIEDAVKRGAAAVVCQRPVRIEVPTVLVENSRKALAAVSANFFENPSEKLTVIGITGTNGKTTTSYLVESILKEAGFKVGVIGTINYRHGDKVFNNPVTTPESLDLQRIFSEMVAEKVTHVVMEVSSHAIDLHRIDHCWMDVGVFTNLSQDHLDYHGDMESYWACKKRLFTEHLVSGPKKDRARAVVCRNEKRGKLLFAEFPLNGISTGRSPINMVYPKKIETDLSGTRGVIGTPYGQFAVRSGLVGDFNVENILSATGVAISLNLTTDVVKRGVEKLECVPGRMERAPNDIGRFVFIDYAHTPDALENALKALRALARNRLICVFGCGGDRDRSKRPIMGKVAARMADLCVVTSDNPRTEPPLQIIEEILSGVREVMGDAALSVLEIGAGAKDRGYVAAPDRRNAIQLAVRASSPGDAILIAGKGHESYQIIGSKTVPFDDRLEAKIALTL